MEHQNGDSLKFLEYIYKSGLLGSSLEESFVLIEVDETVLQDES